MCLHWSSYYSSIDPLAVIILVMPTMKIAHHYYTPLLILVYFTYLFSVNRNTIVHFSYLDEQEMS